MKQGIMQVAASWKQQRLQSLGSDKDSQYGPPDKRGNFCKETSSSMKKVMVASSDTQVTMGQLVEVRYDDDVWYKGEEWIAQFDIDGEKHRLTFLMMMFICYSEHVVKHICNHLYTTSLTKHYANLPISVTDLPPTFSNIQAIVNSDFDDFHLSFIFLFHNIFRAPSLDMTYDKYVIAGLNMGVFYK